MVKGKWFGCVVLLVIALIGSWVFLILNFYFVHLVPSRPIPDLAKQGQFGDAFNSVTSLFSALALLGVVLTILLQMKDMREAGASQERQLEVTHTTARLQALVSLMDTTHRRMDRVEEGQAQEEYRTLNELFTNQTVLVLRELMPDLSEVQVTILSKRQDAVRQLRARYLEAKAAIDDQRDNNTSGHVPKMETVFGRHANRLNEWRDRHSGILS